MDMKTKHKTRRGSAMPIIGLGTWKLTENTAEVIEAALKMGWPMIDTSGNYGTQGGIGEGISRSGVGRDDFYLVTKIESDDDAYEATKKNLEELGLDYANLVLVHWPPRNGAGISLWEGLIKAQKDGLTQEIGVSNYSEDQIEELIKKTGEVPAVNQIEWSPYGYSAEMYRYCKGHNIMIQGYSPLTRSERLDEELLDEIAERYGKSPAQILIRWALQIGVVPLPKAKSTEHLQENLDVFDFELSKQDMATLSRQNEHYSALGGLAYI